MITSIPFSSVLVLVAVALTLMLVPHCELCLAFQRYLSRIRFQEYFEGLLLTLKVLLFQGWKLF